MGGGRELPFCCQNFQLMSDQTIYELNQAIQATAKLVYVFLP